MRSPPLPALLRVRGQRYFSAALVLLFGATRHGDGTDDVATFDDRHRAAPGHDTAVTRHDQALKPRLPGNPRQLLRGLLETGRSVSFVQRDFHRDGAGPVTVEIALNKAYTAASFQQPTKELAGIAGQTWFQSLVVSSNGRIMPGGGAVPIVEGGNVVGAVAVAGGTEEQDQRCAEVALASYA